MTDLILDPVYLDRFLTLSQALHFPTNEAQVRQFVEHMHLPDAHEPKSKWNAFRIQDLNGGIFLAAIIDNELFDITLDLAAIEGDTPSDADTERLDTVFQQATATITDRLGKPTTRKRGKRPAITWTMPNEGRIRLVRGLFVKIYLETPANIALDGVEAR